MVTRVLPGRTNKGFHHRLTLLAIAHGGVQPAPQPFTQCFGDYQALTLKALHHPVWQRRNAHPRRHHLNQQQRVIDAFQRWADTSRLQEVPPDIQPLTLNRIDHQNFTA